MLRDEDIQISPKLDEGIRKKSWNNVCHKECSYNRYVNLDNFVSHVGEKRRLGEAYSLKREDVMLTGDTIYNKELQSILGDILIDEYGHMELRTL